MELVLVRHGEAVDDAAKEALEKGAAPSVLEGIRHLSDHQYPLSPLGFKQAEKAKDKVSKIWASSPLPRRSYTTGTVRTDQTYCSLQLPLTPVKDERMGPQAAGSFMSLPADEQARQRVIYWEAVKAGNIDIRSQGGQSIRQKGMEVISFWEDQLQDPEGTRLVVAHSVSILLTNLVIRDEPWETFAHATHLNPVPGQVFHYRDLDTEIFSRNLALAKLRYHKE